MVTIQFYFQLNRTYFYFMKLETAKGLKNNSQGLANVKISNWTNLADTWRAISATNGHYIVLLSAQSDLLLFYEVGISQTDKY